MKILALLCTIIRGKSLKNKNIKKLEILFWRYVSDVLFPLNFGRNVLFQKLQTQIVKDGL